MRIILIAVIGLATTACAAPSSPTAIAPTTPAILLQDVAGTLVLSASATTVVVGNYTTLRVALAPNVTALRWIFGDGEIGQLARTEIQHWYPASGRYRATLTATTSTGASETVHGDIDVLPAPPMPSPPTPPVPVMEHVQLALTQPQPAFAEQGGVVMFNVRFTGPYGWLNTWRLQWNYGDGTILNADTSSSVGTMHAYAAPGTYIVTASVHDTDGGVITATTTAVVY